MTILRSWVAGLLIAAGCSATPSANAPNDTDTEAGSSSGSSTEAGSTGPLECTTLYGRPNENTGLGPDQCGPACPCLDGWEAPEYTEADIAALEAFSLTAPFALLPSDPYATPDEYPLDATSVCGVLVDGDGYALQTFADDASAEAAGAKVTHDGACGLCSPLQDLAVYMRNPDLTQPVREGGIIGLSQGEEAQQACLRELGFTEPCAQIWGFNTTHTRTVCLQTCLDLLDAPYHEPDGSLNACLQCDEDMSGPVFKAVAGRTRRNTGLASALCRPCDEVRRVVHRY